MCFSCPLAVSTKSLKYVTYDTEHQKLLCHMISSHGSGHVPGSTKLHSHPTIPASCWESVPLTVCSKSQVFPPKACNAHASFKSKIHLGLGRGVWWSWALLLLRQVQERCLVGAPSPRRWVWCKKHYSEGELGFAEPSEH